VKNLNLRGKIGVYGRSLGGIASCHLANKYPDIVKSLIVDRTFCELDSVSQRRLLGRCTNRIYKVLSYNWVALNDTNFAEAKCHKILTCDPNDDVVEIISSLPSGVARVLSKENF
jgi:pimeloyl-ACP methyl ester carboxylesterase